MALAGGGTKVTTTAAASTKSVGEETDNGKMNTKKKNLLTAHWSLQQRPAQKFAAGRVEMGMLSI